MAEIFSINHFAISSRNGPQTQDIQPINKGLLALVAQT